MQRSQPSDAAAFNTPSVLDTAGDGEWFIGALHIEILNQLDPAFTK